jgi:hypothetical protein
MDDPQSNRRVPGERAAAPPNHYHREGDPEPPPVDVGSPFKRVTTTRGHDPEPVSSDTGQWTSGRNCVPPPGLEHLFSVAEDRIFTADDIFTNEEIDEGDMHG